jgi:hypothetical protein
MLYLFFFYLVGSRSHNDCPADYPAAAAANDDVTAGTAAWRNTGTRYFHMYPVESMMTSQQQMMTSQQAPPPGGIQVPGIVSFVSS